MNFNTIYKKSKRNPVLIKWIDSSGADGWTHNENLPEIVNCFTLGFILKEDKDYMTVAGTVADFPEGINDQSNSPMCIPKISIIKIWRLN